MRNYLPKIGVARFNYTQGRSPLHQRLRRLSALEQREEARAFINAFHDAHSASHEARARRWAQIRRSLSRTGFYEHTPDELAFGARVAWRNHSRCIGRLLWETLTVVDCRHLTEPDAMATRINEHMSDALGEGRIRSIISVFAPVCGTALPSYVESPQITLYAGYMRPDGTVLGDRQNVEITRIVQSLGWLNPAEPGRFDLLPYIIRDQDDRRSLFSPSPTSVGEIAITHPTHVALSELELRWYSVPCVSNMILTIGGIEYPCAPFNGFYMCTEIASRNFADLRRYNILREVAPIFGLDPNASGPPMWRDQALTELNRAVLYSFRSAGVTILDHHAASDQFIEFYKRENQNGRRVAADWSWIVPPQASAATEVFHLPMQDFHPVPNYYHSRADDGLPLMPYYGDQYRSLGRRVIDRVMNRWKLWKRMAW